MAFINLIAVIKQNLLLIYDSALGSSRDLMDKDEQSGHAQWHKVRTCVSDMWGFPNEGSPDSNKTYF